MARFVLTCIFSFCVLITAKEVMGSDKNVVSESTEDKSPTNTGAEPESPSPTLVPPQEEVTIILGEVNDLEQTTADPEIIETTDPNIFYEKFPKVKTIMDDINFDQSNETEDEFMSGRASCECGRTSQRIVGGEPARISDYPFTAALTRGGSRPYCGGTLINSRYVLTASHCVDGMSAGGIQVVLYQQYVSSQAQTQRFYVSRIIMHPSYDRRTVNNDLALIKLSQPVQLGRTNPVVPACVVGSTSTDFTGAHATVLGFGATQQGGGISDVLRKVTIPVLSNNDCNRSKYSGKITQNMLCAGNLQSGGKDSCQGDSGGPLILENGGRRTLIGIVSWGFGCAQPNSPGVYTRVSNYGDWILANTQDGVWCSG